MFDKISVLSFFLFLIVGMGIYEYHVTSRGGESPLGWVIDHLKPSSKAQPSVPTEEQDPLETFEYHAENLLTRLGETHQRLRDERDSLIRRRKEVLERFLSMNQDLEQVSGRAFDVVVKERAAFLAGFPQLNRMKEALEAAFREGDAPQRMKRLEEVKAGLKELRQALGKRPELESAGVIKFLEKIGATLDKDVGEKACRPDKKTCWQRQVEAVDQRMKQLFEERVLDDDGRKVLKVLRVTQEAETIYRRQEKEARWIADRVDESQRYVEEQFQKLVRQLIRVTDNDVRDLIYWYQIMKVESQEVLSAMSRARKLWQEEDQRLRKDLEGLFKSHRFVKRFSSMAEAYLRNQVYLDNLWRDLQRLDTEIEKNVSSYVRLNQEAMNDLGGLLKVDMDRLITDKAYALAKMKTYRIDRGLEKSPDMMIQERLARTFSLDVNREIIRQYNLEKTRKPFRLRTAGGPPIQSLRRVSPSLKKPDTSEIDRLRAQTRMKIREQRARQKEAIRKLREQTKNARNAMGRP